MDEKRFPETTLASNDSRTLATLKIGQETVVAGFQVLPHQAVDLGRHLVTKSGGGTAAPSPKLDP